MRVRIRVSVCGVEMETGRVDRHWLPVGLGYRSAGSTVGDRCVTGLLHKTQKDTFFKYKPKTEIHLLQSLRFFFWGGATVNL